MSLYPVGAVLGGCLSDFHELLNQCSGWASAFHHEHAPHHRIVGEFVPLSAEIHREGGSSIVMGTGFTNEQRSVGGVRLQFGGVFGVYRHERRIRAVVLVQNYTGGEALLDSGAGVGYGFRKVVQPLIPQKPCKRILPCRHPHSGQRIEAIGSLQRHVCGYERNVYLILQHLRRALGRCMMLYRKRVCLRDFCS